MQAAEFIVENLSSVQAVSLLKKMNQMLYAAVPFQQVDSRVDHKIEEVDYIRSLPAETKRKQLSPQDSVQLTKQVLRTMACDDVLGQAVVEAWEEIKEDDSLFIEAIIAVGLIANLTLFMATSDIEFKIGGVHIKKPPADAETVKAIVAPITEMIKKLPMSGG